MSPQLDLYQLRALHAFAQAGTLSGAGQRLFLTPSAISHAIRKLEASAGVALVARRGSRILLTGEGRHLCAACDAIFSILDTVSEDLRTGHSRPSGKLRLGATVEFGCSFLMKHIQPFMEMHPGISIDFTFSSELLEPLLRGDLDLVIDCRGHNSPELQQTPLFRETYVVVCSPDYLAKHAFKEPEDLDLGRILSCDKAGAWWHRFLAALPEDRRPHLIHVTAMNHVRALINGAACGLGVALVPQYCILGELERGSLTPLFPHIRPMEDRFCLYQKRSTAAREKQRLLTTYLKGLTPAEFGSDVSRGNHAVHD
jgi:DNA-binding transcriptional LysR family regulator